MPLTIKNVLDKFDEEFDAMTYFDDDGNLGGCNAAKQKVKQFLQDNLTLMLESIEKELPKEQEIVKEDKFVSESGDYTLRTVKESYNLYRQEVINIINSHR